MNTKPESAVIMPATFTLISIVIRFFMGNTIIMQPHRPVRLLNKSGRTLVVTDLLVDELGAKSSIHRHRPLAT